MRHESVQPVQFKNCSGCGNAWPVTVFVYEDGQCARCNLSVLTLDGNPLLVKEVR